MQKKKKKEKNKQSHFLYFSYGTISAPNSKAGSQKSNLSLIELSLMNNEKGFKTDCLGDDFLLRLLWRFLSVVISI